MAIAPARRGHPAYRYMRDSDGDGVACEQSLDGKASWCGPAGLPG